MRAKVATRLPRPVKAEPLMSSGIVYLIPIRPALNLDNILSPDKVVGARAAAGGNPMAR
jgi:hypothetical protein